MIANIISYLEIIGKAGPAIAAQFAVPQNQVLAELDGELINVVLVDAGMVPHPGWYHTRDGTTPRMVPHRDGTAPGWYRTGMVPHPGWYRTGMVPHPGWYRTGMVPHLGWYHTGSTAQGRPHSTEGLMAICSLSG
ncbi:hypothetical protein chiPu_0025224 [Chiloscyllium punctatum]|uniref:Uncharacterized protein n=1 Tax=Chiloscyllium punctatum TaxID=137246 RepID=A0A401TFE4_CHIPU|nr:hypothetical protein [Chiloscyllium punctatum]